MALFKDRRDAGIKLAEKLQVYAGRQDVLVLALPRGGVPVAYEVSQALKAPLDIFLVRKLGVPGHEELALGAISSGNVRVINQEVVHNLNIPENAIAAVESRERAELRRRERTYRGNRPGPDVSGWTVILIDDGLATGASMYAAIVALRRRDPARIVVAVPTASPETCEAFQTQVDEIICAFTPQPFMGVGQWYQNFEPTSDEEVRDLLRRAQRQEERD